MWPMKVTYGLSWHMEGGPSRGGRAGKRYHDQGSFLGERLPLTRPTPRFQILGRRRVGHVRRSSCTEATLTPRSLPWLVLPPGTTCPRSIAAGIWWSAVPQRRVARGWTASAYEGPRTLPMVLAVEIEIIADESDPEGGRPSGRRPEARWLGRRAEPGRPRYEVINPFRQREIAAGRPRRQRAPAGILGPPRPAARMQVTQATVDSSEGRSDHLQGESRWFPASRFVLAVLIGAGITDLIWSRVPHTLTVSTDIVGYQTWADFDYRRYTDTYYCVAIIFPLLAIAACNVLGRWGPLRRPKGHRVPFYRIETNVGSPGGGGAAPAAPVAADGVVGPDEVLPTAVEEPVESPLAAKPLVFTAFWSVARGVVPALAIAVEVCLVRSPATARAESWWADGRPCLSRGCSGCRFWASSMAVGEDRRDRNPEVLSKWQSSIALVNSLLAVAVVPLLFFVSQKTSVYVSSEHRVVYYHWLPWWLVVIASIGCLGLWVHGLRRVRLSGDPTALEATVLTWLVGPILFFLLLAVLPGASGPFTGSTGAILAAPNWSSSTDCSPGVTSSCSMGFSRTCSGEQCALDVFGNNRWGGGAGISLLMSPLF